MSDAGLQELISNWYGRGILAETDKARLRERYLADLGASTCTTCPDWLRDMQDHFRIYLKTKNLTIMTPNNEYMIRTEVGSLNLPGESLVLINAGGTIGPGAQALTDELAKTILKKYPEQSENIVKNPDYDASAAKSKPDAAAKKKEEEARLKAEKQAADKVKAEEEARLKAEAEAAKVNS